MRKRKDGCSQVTGQMTAGRLSRRAKGVLAGTFMSLCLAVALCISLGGTLKADAETTVLEAGRTYSLSFAKGTTPHMTYIMPDQGYFYYEVTPTYCTAGGQRKESTFYFDVEMSVNNEVLQKNTTIYNGNCGKSMKASFKKGTVIDLAIVGETDSFAMSDNVVIYYDIKITAEAPKNFEKEDNNSKSSANKVKKGKTYSGLIMQNDEDFYVFKAPKKGKYKIQISVASAKNDVDDLYAEAWKGSKRFDRVSTRYGEGYQTVYSGKLKKGAKIYIKAYGPGPIAFSGDLMYDLRVK